MKSRLNSGCYLLSLYVPYELECTIGKLGNITFQRGYYLYIGRARKNLRKRIARHLRTEKKLRWHIDYLLRCAAVTDVYVSETTDESGIARVFELLFPARVVPGFGSSDSRAAGHLFFTFKQIRPDDYSEDLKPTSFVHLYGIPGGFGVD